MPPGVQVPAVVTRSIHGTRPLDRQCAAAPVALQELTGDGAADTSTLDHREMRRLIDTGYRDAASVVGAGWRPTWPYDEKWYMPGVTLDRVLADRRIGVRSARPHRISGSDHKAFYAELVLPSKA